MAVLLAQHGGGAAQIGELGTTQPVGHQRGGDAHAVEDIADVVQHAGGHVGHARAARGVDQLPVELVQLLRIQLVLGDVLEDAAHRDRLAVLREDRAALPDPYLATIRRDHAVFTTVRLAPGRHQVNGLDGLGGIHRLQFFLPEIWGVQPGLGRVTENGCTLAADKSELERGRVAFPDDAVNGIDQRLHFLLREAERDILALDAVQHLVERLREPAQFIAPAGDHRAHRVIFLLADNLRGPRQLHDRMSDRPPQPSRKENRQGD